MKKVKKTFKQVEEEIANTVGKLEKKGYDFSKTYNKVQSLMHDMYIGIDNGVTGSIGIIYKNTQKLAKIPAFKDPNFEGAVRINVPELYQYLDNLIQTVDRKVYIFLEKSMINPTRFKSSISSAKSQEATIAVIEMLQQKWQNLIEFKIIKPTDWQKAFDVNFKAAKANKDIAQIYEWIQKKSKTNIEIESKPKDPEGLVIALYVKYYIQNNLEKKNDN